MYTRGRPKSIFFHFWPKNESRLIILLFFFLFHTFSHQVSPTMRRQTWHRDTSFFVNNGAILLKLPAAADGTVSTTVCWNTRQTMARIQPRVTSQFVSDEILSYIRNKEAASKLRLRCTLFWRCNASSVLVTETAVDGWECDDVMTLCGDDQYFDVVVNSCSSCSSVCRPQLQQQRDYCLQNCPRESASTVLQRLLYASDLSWLYRFRYTVNGDFGRENAVFRRDSIK